MSRGYLVVLVLVVTLSFGGLSGQTPANTGKSTKTDSQSSAKRLRVKPSGDVAKAEQQQLILKGVTASPDVAGFRVYLASQCPSNAVNKNNYVGTMYFGHSQKAGDEHTGDFVVSLPQRVSCQSTVSILPIKSNGKVAALSTTDLDLKHAEIVAVNNSTFSDH